MRPGWEIKTLGDLAVKITDGSHNPPKGVEKSEYLMLSSQNVWNGYLDKSIARHLSKQDFLVEDKRTCARKGDVLLTIVGTIGRTCVLSCEDTNITFQRSVCIIKPKPELNPFFLSYQLQFKNKEINEQANGAAQKGFYLKQVERLSLVITSLPEQQRIVDILDQEFAKIDALKANAEKSLQAAKDLFQATLKKELEPKEGWRTEPFGKVCQYYKEQGLFPSLRYVGMENIEAESGTLLGTMSGEQVQSSSFHFYPGDVLYGRLRPYLKKVVVADFEGCCSTEIFPVRSKECIPSFLQYWFLADDTTNRINATCSGCRMPRANMKDVLSFEISFPDKKEQEEVVQKIKTLCDNALSLQENYQKTLALCEDLKQALLRKAFNGEL